MSFVTGTQAELLYSMPSSGTALTGTVTTGTAALIGGGNAATLPAYQLPAYFFGDTYGVGKSILIQGGGTFATGGVTQSGKLALYLDTTIGTPGTLLVSTGAFDPAQSVAQGTFMFEVLITCTAVGTSATLNAVGRLFWGNSASNAGTVAGVVYLMGTAGAVSFSNATAYYIEPYFSWGQTTTTQTITLTNYLVWGLN